MAVEILAGPVVTHRGARVGVACRDLDIPQVNSGIQTGRERRYAEAYEGAAWKSEPWRFR